MARQVKDENMTSDKQCIQTGVETTKLSSNGRNTKKASGCVMLKSLSFYLKING